MSIDKRAKHRASEARYFDEAEGRRQQKHPRIKFRPRRGPAAIRFPCVPEKALRLLTGRGTYRKALKSAQFFRSTQRKRDGLRPWTKEKIEEEFLEGDW